MCYKDYYYDTNFSAMHVSNNQISFTLIHLQAFLLF